MRNGRAIGLLLGTHLAAVNPKPQGLTLSDRFLTLSDRFSGRLYQLRYTKGWGYLCRRPDSAPLAQTAEPYRGLLCLL